MRRRKHIAALLFTCTKLTAAARLPSNNLGNNSVCLAPLMKGCFSKSWAVGLCVFHTKAREGSDGGGGQWNNFRFTNKSFFSQRSELKWMINTINHGKMRNYGENIFFRVQFMIYGRRGNNVKGYQNQRKSNKNNNRQRQRHSSTTVAVWWI